MFTGIIEGLAQLVALQNKAGNKDLTFQTNLAAELRVDQSLAHNGVCLTVIEQSSNRYTVTAVQETLLRTNLEMLHLGDYVNLERCMIAGDRLDGHIVQGHVDTVGKCTEVIEANGSWYFKFEHPVSPEYLTVSKGSIAVNGISLTVVESQPNGFSVAVIPYTFYNTNFKFLKQGDLVNLEFDIIGKYIAKQIIAYTNLRK